MPEQLEWLPRPSRNLFMWMVHPNVAPYYYKDPIIWAALKLFAE